MGNGRMWSALSDSSPSALSDGSPSALSDGSPSALSDGSPSALSDGSRGAHSGAVSLMVVTLIFDAVNLSPLAAVLSKYVVMTRMTKGCRNVDLAVSVVRENRILIIQKWDSLESQRAHFDSALMVEMATSCKGLLTKAPEIELWDSISAHDFA